MIEAVLRYEVLDSGAASCVLELDADGVEEVVLSTTPLHLTRDGQFINLDAGMPAFTAPSPSTESVVCDPQRRRHIWRGEVADQRLLTIEVKRASVCLGWATAKYEQGRFFVSSALLFGIHLQVATRSFSALAERSQPVAAGSTLEGDDWRRVVRAYARARRTEEVLALFTQRVGRYAAGMTQGGVETFRHIGLFLAVQGHLAQALSAFDLVLREEPTNTDVLLAKGIVLLEMERYAGARLVFQAAVSLDGGRAEAWELLADALLLAEDSPGAALEAYERAIALKPGLASAYHGKGNALSRLGRMSQAHAAYAYAVRLDPFDPCFRESLRVVRAEYSDALSELTARQYAWEVGISPLQQLISRPGGRKPGEDVCLISLDDVQPPIRQVPTLKRDAELDALVRAFFELHHRRIALPWHPIRALRYRLVAAQFKDITRRYDRKTRRPLGPTQAGAGCWNPVPERAHHHLPPVLFSLAILVLALVTLGLLRLGRRHTRLRYPGRRQKGG